MSVKVVVNKKAGKTRSGKGFSHEELREAGMGFQQALRLHLPIDKRRKTKHNENAKALKASLKKEGI
jgi:ribosomal protein L13E